MKLPKKALSVLLALSMIFSISIYAFAAKTPDLYDVINEINDSYSFVTMDTESYTLDDAICYYYLTTAAEEAYVFYEDFKADVLNNLKENDGRLVPSYGENIVTYAAVVGIVLLNGEDISDFEGYNFIELFKNTDPSTVSNPYHYDVVIPVSMIIGDEELTRALCDDFINNYYVMGKGMDYFGFSCDNTAMFISAISQSYLDGYEDVLSDAVNLLDTYKVDGGYCHNPEYGTDINTNSTALALMAKSVYCFVEFPADEEFNELADIYNDLMNLKGEEVGAYKGYDEVYAANDAIKGLSAYADVVILAALINTELGDVNGDGKISVADAKYILQYVAGLREFGFSQELAADVNGDGRISVADAKYILQIVAGIRELEPIITW